MPLRTKTTPAARFMLRLAAAWLALAALTASLHMAALHAEMSAAGGGALKVAASLLYIPSIAGWFLLRGLSQSWSGAGLAAAVGWAPWIAAAAAWRIVRAGRVRAAAPSSPGT